MNPASSSKTLIQLHPQGVPLETREVIRKISHIFEIAISKAAKAKVLGGMDK